MAKLFADMGVVCLCSFISPYEEDRVRARQIHDNAGLPFIEIYLSTSLEVCESRDTKGLYQKARAGKITGFTGIDSAYEAPKDAELIINTGTEPAAVSVQRCLQYLYQKKILPERAMQQLCGPPVRELVVPAQEVASKMQLAGNLPRVDITEVDLQWLQILSEGWATPLYGFMRERQYLQCLHHGQLLDLKPNCTVPGETEETTLADHKIPSPINQSVPIVLAITDEIKAALTQADGSVAQKVALYYEGRPVAILSEPEIYPHRKEERLNRQFGILDRRHPTIDLIMNTGDWLIGGDVEAFGRIRFEDGLDDYRLTPMELRSKFAEAKADCVFVFQLRNPIHNGHALLMQDTRNRLLAKGYSNPMLLLHPLGGWTKDDDVPLKTRIDQHQAVMEDGVLDPSWTVLSIFPSPMLYAGPTEVQWHARARIAAGVHVYIVGRDPAGIQHPNGVDQYLYDPTHGSKVLAMAPGLPHLEVVPFRVAALDKSVGRMAFFDERRKDDFVFISGTKMRGYARDGVQPPDGFMAPKAWKVLADYYQSIAKKTKDEAIH